jgi:hypothetical protein
MFKSQPSGGKEMLMVLRDLTSSKLVPFATEE